MTATRWSPERANEWQRQTPWLCGFNFVPSTAVNTTEFWQAESFDAVTIDRELGLAARTGFNTCRIFLPFVVWQADPSGMKQRLEQFFGMAGKQGLSSAICLFDDCAFSRKAPFLGKQDDPIPGRMSTSWTASPGHALVNDAAAFPALERYVKDIVGSFARDRRVVLWDLYNEPGNEGQREKTLPLLQAAFCWAREVSPEQPLTSGIWSEHTSPTALNQFMLDQSDILNFHLYAPLDQTRECLDGFLQHNRPVICSEWMARWVNSRFQTHLPLFKEKNVGCFCWGLVNGRMQAHIPWDVLKKQQPEKTEWFHDLYQQDGRPYDAEEIAFIQKITG